MKTTAEILPIILKENPSITHFLLRYYVHILGTTTDPKDTFEYEWVPALAVPTILETVARYEKDGKTVGLTNIVMTDKGLRYLLMLDYSVKISEEAERELSEKIHTFNASGDVSYKMDGYLIRTNHSYHYLGTHMTTQENFINFLGSALLFRHSDQKNLIVDDRWLGHSLKKGFATIRLSQKEGKRPEVLNSI